MALLRLSTLSLELTQTAVAVEGENATYVTEHVIVVHTLRVGRAADRADALLLGQEGVELPSPDLVPPAQVVIARAAVQALHSGCGGTRRPGGLVHTAGSTPGPARASQAFGSLPAFLDVPPHELFRVLFQHGVDLVEQVVDVLAQLLVTLGHLRVGFGGRRLVDLLVAAGLTGL